MTVGEIIEKSEPVWIENKNKKNQNPKITVILPTYSRAKNGRFEVAVESVIAQSYTNWELIIVDDASIDGTEDLIKFYMSLDSRISTIRHSFNIGLPAISSYEAYMKARGEYIAFMFDDNVWEKNHLMLAMKTMLKSKVQCTYGVTRSFGNNETADIGGNVNELSIGNMIGNGSVVVHRSIIEDVGYYDPHISLTRLCDWDLWIRISRKYQMERIPIIVTSEYGTSLSDSLGNTIKMNPWVSYERMAMGRNVALRPVNFASVDICEVSDKSTELFYLWIRSLYLNYQKKHWFLPLKEVLFKETVKKYKRIVLVLPDIDATFVLGFQSLNSNVILHPIMFWNLTEKDLLYVDYVLFIRNIEGALKLEDLCKKYNVPFGFYLDDNFNVLIKNKEILENDANYPYAKLQSDTLESGNMSEFADVIMSTNTMKEYYEKIGIYDVKVLPPCIDHQMLHSLNSYSETITIAFMGGEFREKVFVDSVFPALIHLSKKYKIRLICPETLERVLIARYKGKELDNLKIEGKPRLSYQECIHLYRKENVNLLIHTGKESGNNKYKTKNALINAVYLGAILIASNVEPYKDTKAILKANNTVEEWEEHIQAVIMSEQLRKEQYKLQIDYIEEYYEQNNVSKAFDAIVWGVKSTSVAEIINRQQIYLESLRQPASNVVIPSVNSQVLDLSLLQLGHQADELLERFLCFQMIPKRKLHYVAVPPVAAFNQIGFVMAFHEQRGEGEVQLEVLDGKKCVATAKKDLSEIQIRQVNYFELSQSIMNKKKVKLILSVNYKDGATGMMGCYENRDRKNMIYRVCKKAIGIQLPVKNLPYVIFR